MTSALFFEDIFVGDQFVTPARTVTETDISMAVSLSGHYQPIFVDEEFAKKSPYGGRIAPGEMTLGIEAGLVARMGTLENSLGLLDIRLKFLNPVRAGDTLHVELEVLDKKETSKPDRGVITFRDVVKNQRGEIVMEDTRVSMYRRRPTN